MRYPEGHKDEVRARLLHAAAAALRRDGLDGLSIPALMKKAGLTHGTFYAHFKSKEALVAAAVDAAADDTAARVFSSPHVLDMYLSPQHVARPGEGCVVAALGSEGRRRSPVVKRAFARAARGLLHWVDRALHPALPAPQGNALPDAAALSDEALAAASRMVGAVILARLVDDEELQRRLLQAARPPTAAAPTASA